MFFENFKKSVTGNWTIYNIFRDNLGTITHLKDATTGTVTEYSFDAWGRRRDANDWTTTLTNEPALFADRGFTGHEYLEDFKLYNMNGRLYDPVVGRFLSPDPIIQDPANTQSYNRYSYCLNNPVKYIDPDGNNPFLVALAIVWAGNYAINYLDNTINKKMDPGKAAKQFNFSINYSPSDWKVWHPQIDAQRAANHEENIVQQLKKLNPFKNVDVSLQGDWKITAGVQAGGNIQNIGGKYGLFLNLCSITLLGNEEGKRIYPGSQIFNYSQINQGVSGGFIIGASASNTFDGSFEGGGSVNEKVDIQGLFTNKAGNKGMIYHYDPSTGINTIKIGFVPQVAFGFGFEGNFIWQISW